MVDNANFAQCLIDVRDEAWRQSRRIFEGGTDNHGKLVPLSNTTTAITYKLCKDACGQGPEAIQWSIFSTQFGSWLLPWLGLVSQLPFGANDKLDNLIAVFLTVGSPTLAAYSLVLTVLNGRWVARRFASCTYPNTRNAVRVLSSLQQSDVRVIRDNSLLSSLVVLPENDEWWAELVAWLDYGYTWSIAVAASIVWVIVAYIFTVFDSFTGDVTSAYNANGQGVGSLWLWLLPVVVGWLQVSPKCDSIRLRQAVERANRIAYVAMPDGTPKLAHQQAEIFGISLTDGPGDVLRRDETCTIPIFNYARFFSWVQVVEVLAKAFCAASQRAQAHQSVDPTTEWIREKRPGLPPDAWNRIGTRAQVDDYCDAFALAARLRSGRWGPGVWSRMMVASILALSLQWGTTSAAVLVVWFTPTTGLGCRSATYLFYASLSTLIWILLILSSLLSHYVVTTPINHYDYKTGLARSLSIGFRRIGKILAGFNTIWVLASCIFQFSNFFNRCYCNSSVMMWGDKAYNVLELTADDISDMKSAWIGGVFLASGTALAFIFFINMFINPQIPPGQPPVGKED